MNKVYWLCFIFIGCVIFSCGSRDSDVQEGDENDHSHDIEALQKEVKEHPDSAELIEDLITAYHEHENFDSAISLTKQLINRDPNNAYLWNMLATLHYENGDTTLAINSLEKAVSIYPLADYYLALASIYARKKDKRALQIANLLLSQDDLGNNKTNVYFVKGLYYNFMLQPASAIRVLDSAIALDYTNMNAYREKAIALFGQRKYRDALNILTRATTLQNSYDEGYYWMGRAYEKLDRPDSAILCYQTALLYDKNYSEARDALNRLQKN